ncbi:hypothetical protein ACIGW1_07040 [Streptomyces sp. NPDC053780]
MKSRPAAWCSRGDQPTPKPGSRRPPQRERAERLLDLLLDGLTRRDR